MSFATFLCTSGKRSLLTLGRLSTHRTVCWTVFRVHARRLLQNPQRFSRRFSLGKIPKISFVWSPLLLRTKEEDDSEALKNIPKEVFQKDSFKNPKKGSLRRLIYLAFSYISLAWRFVRLTCTFFPVLLLYPFACVSRVTKRTWWRLSLFACEHSGPTFIKLGQWASTRRDLFDEEFCLIFSKLHNQTQEHSWFYTKQKLRKAFGKNWKKIFAKLDRTPAGSGCVAQVSISASDY